MVTATYKTKHGESTVKVDHLVNRGEWWGETYLIEIGIGYHSLFFVVEADNTQAALDVFADCKYSHLIDIDMDNITEEEREWYYPAGNDSHLVDLENVVINKCKVNYFTKSL